MGYRGAYRDRFRDVRGQGLRVSKNDSFLLGDPPMKLICS